MRKPFIHSLFVGQPKTITDERGTWVSSIYRDRVTGPVEVRIGGLAGDRVAQPYHGSPGAAVCAHLLDHYRFWNARYGMDLQPGSVGENFTLDGLTEEQVCAGDIVRVGTALLQVSGPRIPCANLARRIGRTDWVKLTLKENRTGFYLAVLEGGFVRAGDAWDLSERLNPDAAIPDINRCMFFDFDPDYAKRILEMQGIDPWWQEQAAEKLIQQAEHWTSTLKE